MQPPHNKIINIAETNIRRLKQGLQPRRYLVIMNQKKNAHDIISYYLIYIMCCINIMVKD